MRVFPISTYAPPSERAGNVAYSPQGTDLSRLVKHPDSYLRVLKPRLLQPELKAGTEEYLQTSLGNFRQLLSGEVLISHGPAFWFYEQKSPEGKRFTGWIAGISAKDYEDGKIKKHENTLHDKEAALAAHIGILHSVAEPVLLSGKLPENLREASASMVHSEPDIHFIDSGGKMHSLWEVRDDAICREIREGFGAIPALYIADGHHRTAATCLYIRNSGLDPAKNGIMALIMDEDELIIKSFHRIIHEDAPAQKLEETCRTMGWEFRKLSDKALPEEQNAIRAFSKEGSFLLRPGNPAKMPDAASALDVARLEDEIFPSLFGIQNSRIDSRISFLRGDTPDETLSQMVANAGKGWIFAVPPNSMADIRRVADEGLVMPPKSTWVEPKLMSGMLIMRFI